MTSAPRVSIVLPTYNGERYLDEAISSCVDQIYQDWELIIVDDASIDGTARIVDRHVKADPRVRRVRHEENRKLPAALNTGFSLAHGDYLTWTSDDNAYRPHALSRMAEFLDDHPETDVVYADYTAVDEQAGTRVRIAVGDPSQLVLENIVGACFLYRRTVQDSMAGYAEHLFLVEDYEYWLRAAQHFRLTPLHEDLYIYRYHPRALTATESREINLKVSRLLLDYLPQLDRVDAETRSLGYLRGARLSSECREVELTARHLYHANRACPSLGLSLRSTSVMARAVLGDGVVDLLLTPYKGARRLVGRKEVSGETVEAPNE